METHARFALADVDGCTWLGGLPPGSADALVIDLASAERGRAPAIPLQQLAFEVGRVLARGRRGFWICESKQGLGIARLLERFGLDLAQPVIWDRGDAARGGRLRWILPLSRGRVRGLPALPDLIQASGSGLPDAIAEVLVMMSSVAGQWLLEPFASTPALAQAALRLGRPWSGASPLAQVRGAIAEKLVAIGARASEPPMRWDGGGVPLRAGSELLSQLALGAPSAEPSPLATADDAGTAGQTTDEVWVEPGVRGCAADSDQLRTGAV